MLKKDAMMSVVEQKPGCRAVADHTAGVSLCLTISWRM